MLLFVSFTYKTYNGELAFWDTKIRVVSNRLTEEVISAVREELRKNFCRDNPVTILNIIKIDE